MSKKSRSLPLSISLIVIAGMFWLRGGASHTTQARILSFIFLIGVVTVNYYCIRFVAARAKFPNPERLILVARATKFYALVIGILGVVICDISMVTLAIRLSHGMSLANENDIFVNALVGGFLGYFFTWAGAYEMRLTPEVLHYFSLLEGHRSLALSEIQHARIRTSTASYLDSLRPGGLLDLVPIDHENSSSITVNQKVFKKADLQRVYEWLGDKLKRKGS